MRRGSFLGDINRFVHESRHLNIQSIRQAYIQISLHYSQKPFTRSPHPQAYPNREL